MRLVPFLVVVAGACAARAPMHRTGSWGVIVVSSDTPDGDVYIDGTLVPGEVPISHQVRVGYHDVEVHLKDRRWWRAVSVGPDERVEVQAELALTDEKLRDELPDQTPDQLERSALDAGLSAVGPRVEQCRRLAPHIGPFPVRITISGSTGRVVSVDLAPPLLGTPAESCVDGALRSARFPVFRASTQTFETFYRF